MCLRTFRAGIERRSDLNFNDHREYEIGSTLCGALFCQQTKPRGGAQAKIFDEKFLAAGDSRYLHIKRAAAHKHLKYS